MLGVCTVRRVYDADTALPTGLCEEGGPGRLSEGAPSWKFVTTWLHSAGLWRNRGKYVCGCATLSCTLKQKSRPGVSSSGCHPGSKPASSSGGGGGLKLCEAELHHIPPNDRSENAF